MNPIERFQQEVSENISGLKSDLDVQALSRIWVREIGRHKYAYNFTWLGRPIIQFPQDVMALQEVIWKTKPDLIIETGVAHGGSLILSASILELLGGDGLVVGVDIDIRDHNRVEIEKHPMSKRIKLVQGSSVDQAILDQVGAYVKDSKRVMVVLDSNHTHEHVLQELRLYSPFVKAGSYLLVFDTLIEDMPEDTGSDRPWGKGNNPKTALRQFLTESPRFEIDRDMDAKLLISASPEGFLKCIAN